MQKILDQFVTDILQTRKLVVLTGAGISTGAGLPTYRGQDGIYEKTLIKPDVFMSGTMFARFPTIVWQKFRSYYKRSFLTNIIPTFAHQAISRLEEFIIDTTIITQNVDGLHTDAGSTNVIELHGNARKLRCQNDTNHIRELTHDDCKSLLLPKCHICKGRMRPDVVLFGEYLRLKNKIAVENTMFVVPDMLLITGTSASLPHIHEIIDYCNMRGTKIVVIKRHPDEYLSSIADYIFYTTADDFFQQLFNDPRLIQCSVE